MNKQTKIILAFFTMINILLILSCRQSIKTLQNDLKRVEKEYLELNHDRQVENDCLQMEFSNFKVEYFEKHPNCKTIELKGF